MRAVEVVGEVVEDVNFLWMGVGKLVGWRRKATRIEGGEERTYDATFCVFVIGIPAYAHDHGPDVALRLRLPLPFALPFFFPVAIATSFPVRVNINPRPPIVYPALYVLIPAYA